MTSFTLADLEQSEADIAAVEQAIAALEAGTYAICSVCGDDIANLVTANPLASCCANHG